jgi:hypothetical protein
LTGAVVLAVGSSVAVPDEGGDDAPAMYLPKEADFRPEYERDQANQRVQSWNEYWGWIRSFYGGNFGWEGWVRVSKENLGTVTAADVRKELITLHNDLGRRVAREWAKDNGLRKISTNDLVRWNRAIQKARRSERGSGARLKAALEAIDAEATRQLKG